MSKEQYLMSMAKIMGCASATNTRLPNDAYATPAWCTRALIKVEQSRWPELIWEPCFGLGDISNELRARGSMVIETDLAQGEDFLRERAIRATAIVTNPPFKYASAFILHAANLGVSYHAWLLKADFLNAQRAIRLIDKVGYPARICAMTDRPDFLGQGAPTMNCSWFVFEGRSEHSELRLLPRE
jgi:hypothetical protein